MFSCDFNFYKSRFLTFIFDDDEYSNAVFCVSNTQIMNAIASNEIERYVCMYFLPDMLFTVKFFNQRYKTTMVKPWLTHLYLLVAIGLIMTLLIHMFIG